MCLLLPSLVRADTQRTIFEKIFDKQKSDMTIELLHGNGILKGPVIRKQEDSDEAWSDNGNVCDFGDIIDIS